MFKRTPTDDPYARFLSKHRSLAQAADLVLQGIGDFGSLRTVEDFRSAAKSLREEADSAEKKDTPTFRSFVEGKLLPRKIDRRLLRRFALAGRATQVIFGHSPWHHQIICGLLLSRGLIVQMPNGAGKTLALALAAAAEALAGRATHIVTSNDYLAERDCRWMGRLYQRLGFNVGVVFTAQSLHFKSGILEPDGATLRMLPTEEYRLMLDTLAPPAGDMSELALPPAPEVEPDNTDAPAPQALTAPGEQQPDSTPYAGRVDEIATLQLPHTTESGVVVDNALTFKQVLSCDIVYGKMYAFGFAYLQDNLAMSAEQQTLTRRDTLLVDECDTVLLDDLRTPLIVTRDAGPSPASSQAIGQLHKLACMLSRGIHFSVNGKWVRFTYEGLDRLREIIGQDLFTPETGVYAAGVMRALQAIHAYQRDEDYIVHGAEIVPVDTASGRLLFGSRYASGLHEAIEFKEGLGIRDSQPTQPVAVTTIKHFARQYSTVAGTSGAIGVAEEYRQFYDLDTIEVEPYPKTRHDRVDCVFRTQRESIDYGVIPEAVKGSRRGQPVLVNVPTLQQVREIAAKLEQAGVPLQVLDASTVQTLGEEAEKVKRAGSPGLVTVGSKLAARGTDIVLSDTAKRNGGLLVIGLERAMDRRYDDQLRGRAARHGDPGETLFVLSLDSDLMRVFAQEWVSQLLERMGMDEGTPIDSKMITHRIEVAQRAIQRRDHAARTSVVELDDIVERHRTLVYRVRQKLLDKPDVSDEINTILENWVYVWQQTHSKSQGKSSSSSPGEDGLQRFRIYLGAAEVERVMNVRNLKARGRVLQDAVGQALARALHSSISPEVWRSVLLGRLDKHWRNYLAMESESRENLGLYPSDDPGAMARYAQAMEEHFDAFFLRVGDEVLTDVVSFSQALGTATVEAG